MEPATVGLYLGKKVLDQFSKRFTKDVIERWSRRRAINFFGAFVETIGEGKSEIKVATKLDELLESDTNQEILFEAYRMVSLSRSREIGPRAIALMTAKVVLEGRQFDSLEEIWLRIFETFSDEELIETQKWFVSLLQNLEANHKGYAKRGNQLVIEWNKEVSDVTGEVDRTPFNFSDFIGTFAGKLASLDVIAVRVEEKTENYKADGEYVDEDGTTRTITYWLETGINDLEYAKVIDRANRMVPIKTES